MPVILILLISCIKEITCMTAILLCFFSPITKTDIPTPEYSSTYLYTNFEHFMLT